MLNTFGIHTNKTRQNENNLNKQAIKIKIKTILKNKIYQENNYFKITNIRI